MDNEKEFTCKHYKCSCLIIAECCKRTYPCRFCHDENETHKIDRYATKEIMCMFCNSVQEPSSKCKKCAKQLAKYFCGRCNLWTTQDDDIYHCEKCNLCRVGKKEEFFHCVKCNACLDTRLKNSHIHIENTLKSDCPICAEYLFTSVRDVTFLKCGHAMHTECFDYYLEKNYQCPICLKSMGNMNLYGKKVNFILDNVPKFVKNTDNWVCEVSCYDCREVSKSQYRYLYNQCQVCKSYNTRIIEIQKEDK